MPGALIGVSLLYIGFVLIINAIWLMGKVDTKDVGVFNLIVGSLGTLVALWYGLHDGLFAVTAGSLLFAFTYIWVGINAVRGATDQRALGWYCVLVSIICVPYAINAWIGGDPGWAFNWLFYGGLWFTFWLLLTLSKSNLTNFIAWYTFAVGAEVVLVGYLYLYDLWPWG